MERLLALVMPAEKLTVSEWADLYRQLSSESSATAGPWKTSKAEYQREPMDAFSDPSVFKVVLKWASQTGKTDVILNCLGWSMDIDPGPTLLLQPTVAMAQAFSKDRVEPMIRDTRRLHRVFGEPKSRKKGDTILHKQFPGGHLTMTGSNAPAELAMRPVRRTIFDEVDRYPPSAGDEGSPIALGEQRAANFFNRMSLAASTPAIKGESAIDDEYELSDKRMWHVPCPQCGEYQTFSWSQVEWDKKKDPETGKILEDAQGHALEHFPETAVYICEHCGDYWDDGRRRLAVSRGKWIATAPFKGIRGYEYSGIGSPFIELQDLVRKFLKGKRSGLSKDMQVFVNTILGESFEETGEALDPDGLKSRRENWDRNSIPERVLVITVGTDTQNDRLETQVCGWGIGEECWVIDYIITYGDPNDDEIWNRHDEILRTRWQVETGQTLGMFRGTMDVGGQFSERVHTYCEPRFGGGLRATRGSPTATQIWPFRASKTKRYDSGQYRVFMLGVDAAKDALFGRLSLGGDGPMRIHFASDLPDEYFDGLVSEERRTVFKRGRPQRVWWPKSGVRNEPLDTWVLAFAAIKSQRIDWPTPETLEDHVVKMREKHGRPAPKPEETKAGSEEPPRKEQRTQRKTQTARARRRGRRSTSSLMKR